MKIVLSQFEINKVGGINTYTKHLKKGLELNGHQVTTLYLKKNEKRINSIANYDKTLGFNTSVFATESVAFLNEFDLIIFSAGIPHEIKGITSEWIKLFTETKPPKITILHDMYYKRLYKWLDRVTKYTKIISLQEKTSDSIKDLIADKKLIRLPIDNDGCGLFEEEKEDLVIDNNHFKTCKHKEVYLQAVPKIEKEYKKEIYGRRGELICCIMINGTNKDYVYPNGKTMWSVAEKHGMEFKKEVTHEEMTNQLKKCKVLVDMSRFKGSPNIDYTILEAMKYGAIPITNTKLPDIFEEGLHYYKIDKEDNAQDLANLINVIIGGWVGFKFNREANLEVIKQLDIKEHGKQIVETGFEDIVIPKVGLGEWM